MSSPWPGRFLLPTAFAANLKFSFWSSLDLGLQTMGEYFLLFRHNKGIASLPEGFNPTASGPSVDGAGAPPNPLPGREHLRPQCVKRRAP